MPLYRLDSSSVKMAQSAGARDRSILGPAAKNLSSRGPDFSQLKTPISTSLSGTKQVIHALECGTGEVKEYLLEEINLMYECKTCFSVFRSIANLVAHKRTFCKSKYKELKHSYADKEDRGGQEEFQTVVVEAEPVECVVEQEDISLDNYAPSLELLKTAGILQDISNKPAVNRLLPPGKTGLTNVVNKLRARQEGVKQSHYQHHQRRPPVPPSVTNTQVVHLEPMYETESGLMQSWRVSEDGETLGETYRAWQEAEQDKQCYQVWPNGHVTSSKETIKLVTGPTGETFSVRVPVEEFASIDDLDSDDEDSGYVKYPCPTCRKTYSRIMNVFHHMVKVHDVTMQEAKAKRKMINNQSVMVEGRRSRKKVSENFSRPVKPVQVKLKNYSLDCKVPLNLCDKLSTAGTTACPILSSNCLSDSTSVQPRDLHKAETLNRLVAEREGREKEEEELPEEVNKKLMEFVNRRRVECRLCGEQFSRTYLLKNHIAGVHLKLHRWTCKDCDFGCWSKYQGVNHAVIEHKYNSSQSALAAVRERTKEEYFDNNPRCQQRLTSSAPRSRSESCDEPDRVNGDILEIVEDSHGSTSHHSVEDSPPLPPGSPSSPPESSSPESFSSEDAAGDKRKRTVQANYNVRNKRTRKESPAEEASLKMVFSKVCCIKRRTLLVNVCSPQVSMRPSPSVSPSPTAEVISEVRPRRRPGPKSRTRQLSPSPEVISRPRPRPGPKSRTRQLSPSPVRSRESSVSNLSDVRWDL